MGKRFREVAENIWVGTFPLKMVGVDLQRNTTVIRLDSGKTVIHSTGPFTREDIAEIQSFGEPGWLVDSLLRHDTFASDGRAAFPDLPYLAPEGFSTELDFPTALLLPAPEEWGSELQVIKVGGAPTFEEHVVFHPASRTLIVADLLVHFPAHEPIWSELVLKASSVGGRHTPGMTRLFRAAIQDEQAFGASMGEILALDFERIIVGHGEIIEANGRALLADVIRSAELPLA